MAFSTRVATMPHDVAVPEDSADVCSLIGVNNRERLLAALELRHRALACGAKHHRHPTRSIPFPLSGRTPLPAHRKTVRAYWQSGDRRWIA